MKIVDRRALMEMPAGMIYFEGSEWDFHNLRVKGDTIRDNTGKGIDWGELDIADSVGKVYGANTTNEEMFVLGESAYIQPDYYGRNGMFDDSDRFMVFEPKDLDILMQFCFNALLVWKNLGEEK